VCSQNHVVFQPPTLPCFHDVSILKESDRRNERNYLQGLRARRKEARPHSRTRTACVSGLSLGSSEAHDAPDLREHCLNAVSVESSKGVRLAKEKQLAKIGCVALSFAVLAALQYGRPPSLNDTPSGTPEPDENWDPRWPYNGGAG
jgi:hypothetical protein